MPRSAAAAGVPLLLLAAPHIAAAVCTPAYAPGRHFIEVTEPDLGRTRQWLLFVPPNPAPAASGKLPLAFVFHGSTSNPYFMDTWLNWSIHINASGWIGIAPFGTAPHGNRTGPGSCCDPTCDEACCATGEHTAKVPEYQCGWETEPTLSYGKDIAFTRYMVQWAADHACVDTSNVFSTGHSNGAAFSTRLACQAADLLSGVAAVSANLLDSSGCSPSRPVPFFEFCGTSDPLCMSVPFDAGGDKGNIQAWAGRNGCSNTTTPSQMTATTNCTTYTGCAAGTELCEVANLTHQWPGHPSPDGTSPVRPSSDPDATAVIFARFAGLVA